MTQFDIKKIAIIGGGPGGLASLYEFLHTSEEGKYEKDPGISKFKEIVVFEQKDQPGGIWATSVHEADPAFLPQKVLDSENYNNPSTIQPSKSKPTDLSNYSLAKPYTKKRARADEETEWKRSGVFSNLFTNIPARFTRFSHWPNEPELSDKSREIYPFLTHKELTRRVKDFISREKLEEYIRTNSRVEDLTKNDNNKWVLSVKHTNDDVEEWYQEEYDAVVIANGHYTVPNIPKIKGLAEFNKQFPRVFIHAKSYRDQNIFKNKKVLIVGGSISSANLIQYVVPFAKETYVSRRGPHLIFPWINSALESEGIVSKPTIEEFSSELGEVVFSDGSRENGFDAILFTTGYHYHYPFLNKYVNVVNPSNLSRVSGLYRDTFSTEDPTLAAVGVAVSGINFHSIEASAAAISGVWSNTKSLPSKSEQVKWEEDRVKEIGGNIFYHYYPHTHIKAQFVDPLIEFSAENRPNPLEEDGKHVQEIDEGFEYLEKLFYKIKNSSS